MNIVRRPEFFESHLCAVGSANCKKTLRDTQRHFQFQHLKLCTAVSAYPMPLFKSISPHFLFLLSFLFPFFFLFIFLYSLCPHNFLTLEAYFIVFPHKFNTSSLNAVDITPPYKIVEGERRKKKHSIWQNNSNSRFKWWKPNDEFTGLFFMFLFNTFSQQYIVDNIKWLKVGRHKYNTNTQTYIYIWKYLSAKQRSYRDNSIFLLKISKNGYFCYSALHTCLTILSSLRNPSMGKHQETHINAKRKIFLQHWKNSSLFRSAKKWKY